MNETAKCSACGFLNLGFEYLTLTTSRGTNSKWIKCRSCEGFFLSTDYDGETESSHAAKTSYGDEATGKELNVYKNRLIRHSLEQVKKYAPPPKTLLDIGASYGGFLFMAKEGGYEVEGTDIVPAAIEYLQEKEITAYMCYSLAELDASKKYDVITAIDCNCYWPDQAGELKIIKEKLNPDGILLMRVVGKSWIVNTGLFIRNVLRGFGNKVIRRGLNDHRFSMPIKSLVALLKESGYELLNVSVKGAQHSEESNLGVKLSFTIGEIIYKLTGKFLAPGAILVLKKKTDAA